VLWQPPCPKGVDYCVRVTPFAPPDVSPEAPSRFVITMLAKQSLGADRVTLEAVLGPGAKARAAAILAAEPSDAQLRAAALAAAGLGIDIAPTLYTPFNITDHFAWQVLIFKLPDNDLRDFMVALGRKDAALWARRVTRIAK
jgi:hypothetical protein